MGPGEWRPCTARCLVPLRSGSLLKLPASPGDALCGSPLPPILEGSLYADNDGPKPRAHDTSRAQTAVADDGEDPSAHQGLLVGFVAEAQAWAHGPLW